MNKRTETDLNERGYIIGVDFGNEVSELSRELYQEVKVKYPNAILVVVGYVEYIIADKRGAMEILSKLNKTMEQGQEAKGLIVEKYFELDENISIK